MNKIFSGSYSSDDVIFLLKDIGDLIKEMSTKDREKAIQSGKHYSEMIPIEYKPSNEYMNLFYSSLKQYSRKIAMAVSIISEDIISEKGKDLILVSLARAGTPIGILVKRYILYKYNINIAHYSISIIRGKGIDENAIKYILRNHPNKKIQFVDGWTGKGAIKKVLNEACIDFENKYNIKIDNKLAVLSDPGYCANIFGTREDFLIPSACLNSTVSGLISRTIHRSDLIKENDFHGVKYYKELINEDVSNLFIDRIVNEFDFIKEDIKGLKNIDENPEFKGLKEIQKIQEIFQIKDVNLIKPGIGETTRVLLRRIPWKILIKNQKNENLEHILLLAKEKNINIEIYPNMSYECCGIIKSLRSDI